MNAIEAIKNALTFNTIRVAPKYQDQYNHYYQLYNEAISEQRSCDKFSMRSRQLDMYITEIIERIQMIASRA